MNLFRVLRPTRRFHALTLVAAAWSLDCRGTPPAAPTEPWNVVVLMVDTLRADRLDFYGYARKTAPHLAELAQSGVLMRNAHSQAGCTYPSVGSFLTSRWPQYFMDRQDTSGMGIPADAPTVTEILAGRGYSTAAVSSSVIVRATPSNVNFQGGYGRGFGTFDETCRERAADCVNARAEELLDRLPRPFFLYLHYLDPHQPYQPPPGHRRRLATALTGSRWAQRGDVRRVVRRLYNLPQRRPVDPQEAATLSDLYDEEVAYLDERLGELMARLERDGLLESTIVVLLADHGEELLDHGEWGHCRSLAFETVLHTPLVLWIPGGPRGVARDGQASNVDVVPTLLDLLAVPYDPKAFVGVSLRPMIDGSERRHDRIAFSFAGNQRVANDGRWKVRLDLAAGTASVYDLRIGEHAPATEFDRPAVTRLATALRAWIEQQEQGKQGDNLRRARETEAQLKALGYL